jgi:hypothetical protein
MLLLDDLSPVSNSFIDFSHFTYLHCCASFVLGVPLLTYLITYAKCIFKLTVKISWRPPSDPYWLPFIGNALSVLLNGEKYFLRLQYV